MAGTKAMTLEEVGSALTGESAELVRRRRAFRRLPSPPRCKLCAAPFAGIGSVLLGPAGFRRSPARAGEVLVSTAAAEAAGPGTEGRERRTVEIRGRVEPVEVIVLRPAEVEPAADS